MDQSLKNTPSAWVRLDKNAKAPISREKPTIEINNRNDDKASPPLARPLYVPAPVAPVATPDSDFADLPGEEIQVPPSNTAPSTPKKNDAPKRGDALEGLINQVT